MTSFRFDFGTAKEALAFVATFQCGCVREPVQRACRIPAVCLISRRPARTG